METKNYYWFWKSALTPEQCQKIIDLGDGTLTSRQKSGFDTTAIIGNDEPEIIADVNKTELFKVRKCDIAWLTDKWLYDLVHPYVQRANVEAGWNYDWDFSEALQYTVYPEGGFYGWHTDQGMSCNFGMYNFDFHDEDTHRKQNAAAAKNSTIAPCVIQNPVTDPNLHHKIRKLSVTLTLSEPDEYTGGNLEFDLDKRFKNSDKSEGFRKELTAIRPQGSIVVFPSYAWHQIKEITSGTRKSLVLWSCGNPYR